MSSVPSEDERKKIREKKKVHKAMKLKKKEARKAAGKPQKVEKQHKFTPKTEAFKHLLQAKPRNYSIGNSIIHKLDLTRFVKWPKYVRLQRQRRILYKRLRVPPAINQFTNTVERKLAQQLFKFLHKYRPEEKKEKEKRLKEEAKSKLESKEKKPKTVGKRKAAVRFGVNEVVGLVERKKASLVVIAHDVDPIEMVLYLPGLCKKLGVPYCIVKGKSRLGKLVHQKQTTCLALTRINKEDRTDFNNLVRSINQQFTDRYLQVNRKWGGNQLSKRSRQHQAL